MSFWVYDVAAVYGQKAAVYLQNAPRVGDRPPPFENKPLTFGQRDASLHNHAVRA